MENYKKYISEIKRLDIRCPIPLKDWTKFANQFSHLNFGYRKNTPAPELEFKTEL